MPASIVFGLLFVGALVGQAFTGWKQFNAEQTAEGFGRLGLGDYLTSANFAVDVTENGPSEYLQFTFYILLTVLLLQRGSPESKELDSAGLETKKDQSSPATRPPTPQAGPRRETGASLYSDSLVLVMTAIFLASWLAQSIAGRAAFNETRFQHLQPPVKWIEYLVNADFWARSLQNWQSEFLAVGTLVVFTIYLRQRGSPESKPVGERMAAPESRADALTMQAASVRGRSGGDRGHEVADEFVWEVASDIGLADDADEAVAVDDREAAYLVVGHGAQGLRDRVVGADSHGLALGQVFHLGRRGVAVVGNAVDDDVAVGDHACEPVVVTTDGEGAHPEVAHLARRVDERVGGPGAFDSARHDVACSRHGFVLSECASR